MMQGGFFSMSRLLLAYTVTSTQGMHFKDQLSGPVTFTLVTECLAFDTNYLFNAIDLMWYVK